MKKLLALVLALVMSMSLVTISNAAFKDADSIPAWAQNAFAWAVEQGIVSGTRHWNRIGLYLAPHDDIKRCESVKILVVYAKLK